MNELSKDPPLVSIIIPCYNHGRYLATAIESALKQTYSPVEIIVVDDGSTDNTKEVAKKYPEVIYIFQFNQGLSASRNKGISKSNGTYLVFLDADDWLYTDAIKMNLSYLQQNEYAAYVSGAYDGIYENENRVMEVKREIHADHYRYLLNRNFIGVPAAVMYRRWVFDDFIFDTTLKSCEDYDLYLKVSRIYPVIHHTEKIAAYRKHATSMSSNFPVMLSSALSVLERQKNVLKNSAEIQAYKKGQIFWKTYYAKKLYRKLFSAKTKISGTDIRFLLKNNIYFFLKFIIKYPVHKLSGKA